MSVHGFKDQTRNLTRQRAPVTLRDMIAVINPTIRGWGKYSGATHEKLVVLG